MRSWRNTLHYGIAWHVSRAVLMLPFELGDMAASNDRVRWAPSRPMGNHGKPSFSDKGLQMRPIASSSKFYHLSLRARSGDERSPPYHQSHQEYGAIVSLVNFSSPTPPQFARLFHILTPHLIAAAALPSRQLCMSGVGDD
jgi:hypothetical protein